MNLLQKIHDDLLLVLMCTAIFFVIMVVGVYFAIIYDYPTLKAKQDEAILDGYEKQKKRESNDP